MPRRFPRSVPLLSLLPLSGLFGCESGPSETPLPDAALLSELEGAGADTYALRAEGDAVLALNPAHGLVARIGAGGLAVRTTAGEELTLAVTRWGRAGALDEAAVGAVTIGACGDPRCLGRAEVGRGALDEWWENGTHGLEQGWTIAESPEGVGEIVVELRFSGLAPVLDADGLGLTFEDSRLTYDGLRAWDAGGRALPAWMEVGNDGHVELHVDDAHARWPITIDPVLAESVTVFGTQAFGKLGQYADGAGDVDGDGYDDVIALEPGYPWGGEYVGRAGLYRGTAEGLSAAPAWTDLGTSALHAIRRVQGLGDLDGDGLGDFVVSTADGFQVFYGRRPTGDAAWSPRPTISWGLTGVGESDIVAADVGCDGTADLLVAHQLGVYAYQATAYEKIFDHYSNFGPPSLAVTDDLDADGCGELVVSWTNGGPIEVYDLAPGFSRLQTLPRPSTYLAAELAIGDVDGDGLSDLVLAFPVDRRVEVHRGSSAGTFESAAWTGAIAASVIDVADVDGDGDDDVMLGMYEPGAPGGSVAVYAGGATDPFAARPIWTRVLTAYGSGVGVAALADAGDVDGDGLSDLVIGAGSANGPAGFDTGVIEVHTTPRDQDTDGDGIPDAGDLCPNAPDPLQADADGDGLGDTCDPDDDGDTVVDVSDNCALLSNPDQADADGDSEGDACDADDDGDGIADGDDNCGSANADQGDFDLDGIGDACDDDDDGDGVSDDADNCPETASPDQANLDGDPLGDACDADDDGDGVADADDDCPAVWNQVQGDADGDGAGDACDPDDDGDGVADVDDNCATLANADQSNGDGDVAGDACDDDDDNDGISDGADNCAAAPNAGQGDADADGSGDACDDDTLGDACDDDVDGDGWLDDEDLCPDDFDPDQADLDLDGYGDACDDDVDGDDVPDDRDACPRVQDPMQSDADADGAGDACDPDDDGDGIADTEDGCPWAADPAQSDADGDGHGDVCDDDDDGDDVLDGSDLCPSTPPGAIVDLDVGCSVAELCPCDGPRGSSVAWRNHGQYQSCVATSAGRFATVGLLTSSEQGALTSSSAASTCGKR